MTRFIIYAPDGRQHNIESQVTAESMRSYISEFKTHCATTDGQYVLMHFINWVRKYKGNDMKHWSDEIPTRIDM
jgi:hypothetical protein